MSSYSSLSDVTLNGITGLSNTDLREWLSEIAPSLVSLRLCQSFFPREHHDEEHAVDATIHIMYKLESVHCEGDVVSALAIERTPKKTEGRSGTAYINTAPSINEPGLTHALECTGFREVIVNRVTVFKDGRTQGNEAIRHALQKGLAFQPS